MAEGREQRCAGCGNDLRGDNLCMVSACQWEGAKPERERAWSDDEREERWMEIAAEEDPEPTVEDDLDLAVALLHNRPDPHGDLRDDAWARAAMAWTDQFDLLMGRYKKRKASRG